MNIKNSIIGTVRRISSGSVNIKKLKAKGLTLGDRCWFGNGVFIDPTFCSLITIGNNCTITSNVHILAHDASIKNALGYTKIGQVHIGSDVFIGANTIILPNVTIGDQVVVAAGSVVTKNIPTGEVWGGNPAKKICTLDVYIEKHKSTNVLYSNQYEEDTFIERIREITREGIAYIE